MSPGSVEIPRWQSHKEVRADKIVEVRTIPIHTREDQDDSGHRWILACGAYITVGLDLKYRGGENPVGGYYVEYADGFKSWSPQLAFEEGYTRI